jgi:hypothetical protein
MTNTLMCKICKEPTNESGEYYWEDEVPICPRCYDLRGNFSVKRPLMNQGSFERDQKSHLGAL